MTEEQETPNPFESSSAPAGVMSADATAAQLEMAHDGSRGDGWVRSLQYRNHRRRSLG